MNAAVQEKAPIVSDSRRELSALFISSGVYRRDTALFSITGPDRVRWLNGMVTNNIRDLAPGHGVYAFVLNSQGQILGDLYVFNRGQSLVAEIVRSQVETLLPLLRRYIIMDKVEIQDLSDKTAVVALTGPKSAGLLASLGLSADLAGLQLENSDWHGFSMTLVRGDNPCVPNFELWLPAEKADSVIESLREKGAEPVSDETLEMFRIICGIPKFRQDIRERALPQETGQDRALNFTKGCYIGQEIVERIRARGAVHRMFCGFILDGTVPPAGAKIQSEGRDVGELTTIAAAPLKGKWLALGFLRKEFAGEDKVLTAGETRVRPTSLPFSGVFDHSES